MVRTSIWSSVRRPQRLRIGRHAERRNRGMSSGWMTWMCDDVRTRVREPVRLARGRDRVERIADGAIADRVEVGLEPERIEARHPRARAPRDRSAEAAVVGRVAVVVEVRIEHRRP